MAQDFEREDENNETKYSHQPGNHHPLSFLSIKQGGVRV